MNAVKMDLEGIVWRAPLCYLLSNRGWYSYTKENTWSGESTLAGCFPVAVRASLPLSVSSHYPHPGFLLLLIIFMKSGTQLHALSEMLVMVNGAK